MQLGNSKCNSHDFQIAEPIPRLYFDITLGFPRKIECHTFKGILHFTGYVIFTMVIGQLYFQTYVTLTRECQTLKGMSHFQRHVTLSEICHTFEGCHICQGKSHRGKSYFQGVCHICKGMYYVTLSEVCHTFEVSHTFIGMSHFRGMTHLSR